MYGRYIDTQETVAAPQAEDGGFVSALLERWPDLTEDEDGISWGRLCHVCDAQGTASTFVPMGHGSLACSV